jgi:uncharacterized protein YkwD
MIATPKGGACERSAAVFSEINSARTDPLGYAASWPNADPEVATFLQHQAPTPPLTYSVKLENAAARQAAGGPVGQGGADGSALRDRIQSAGVYSTVVAETTTYGKLTAVRTLHQLITDGGSAGHAHRGALFSPLMMYAGVGCGPDPKWGAVTVIDLSGRMMTPPPPPP